MFFFVYILNWIDTGGRFFRNLDQIFLKVQYSRRREFDYNLIRMRSKEFSE